MAQIGKLPKLHYYVTAASYSLFDYCSIAVDYNDSILSADNNILFDVMVYIIIMDQNCSNT